MNGIVATYLARIDCRGKTLRVCRKLCSSLESRLGQGALAQSGAGAGVGAGGREGGPVEERE